MTGLGRLLATTSAVLVLVALVLALTSTAEAFAPSSYRPTPTTTATTHRGSWRRATTKGGRAAASIGLVALSMVDESMNDTYNELATRLIERHANDSKAGLLRNDQLFVCVAGGPGSGKSTLAEAVASRINDRIVKQIDSPAAAVLPMDGFHYTRAHMKAMGESPVCEYSYEELIERRGAPWTFDARGCVEAFTNARRTGRASLPIYSRMKSDPVPDGAKLHPETKIVLLEGNYLLAWDDERWAPLKKNRVFDETWYIACKSLAEQRERLVKRHFDTWTQEKIEMFGEGLEGAGRKADSNDMLNLIWIEKMSREHADLIIESK